MGGKRFLLLAVLVLALLLCGACGEAAQKVEPTADYNSIQEAIEAQRSGVDLVGKTIKVVMKQDSAAGIIYSEPDTQIKANLYVTIITNDDNRDEVLGLKKGDTVVVTVDSFDDHLKYSIYVYALEYKIYR